jgi:hypothetical protein
MIPIGGWVSRDGSAAVSERTSGVEALALYHDLWDLKLRAERTNRSFLVYLLDVALEDLQEELAAGDGASAAGDRTSAAGDRASGE